MKKNILMRGFTLIELLIVIAVMAVLAGAVLVAIDPLEQFDRGKDAGRKSGIAQLGHAMQAYATAQTSTGNPPILGAVAGATTLDATNWQRFLIAAGELKNVIVSTPRLAANTCSASATGSKETTPASDMCYLPNASEFVVWVILESKSERSRAQCGASPIVPAAVYSSSQGKAGTGCLSTVTAQPAQNIALF